MNTDRFGALFTLRIQYGNTETKYKVGVKYVSVHSLIPIIFMAIKNAQGPKIQISE